MSKLEHRTITNIEIRTIEDVEDDTTPHFKGYANIWDVTDSYGTRFKRGAFNKGGLNEEETYPLLFMHDKEKVIGTFKAREDEKGLYIEGRFADTQEAQDKRKLAIMGATPELSVGFELLSEHGVEDITSARLAETSLITKNFASTPNAVLTSVRGEEEDAEDNVEDINSRAYSTRFRLSETKIIRLPKGQ